MTDAIAMQPLGTVAELVRAVDQAGFEFEELAICAEDDLEDELHDYAEEFKEMAKAMYQLRHQLEGQTEFVSHRGVTFMGRARALRAIIPFFRLIEAIDAACRNGVSERGADVG